MVTLGRRRNELAGSGCPPDDAVSRGGENRTLNSAHLESVFVALLLLHARGTLCCVANSRGFFGDQVTKDATGGHSTSKPSRCGTCRLIRTTTLPFRRQAFITSDPILLARALLAPVASGQPGVIRGCEWYGT